MTARRIVAIANPVAGRKLGVRVNRIRAEQAVATLERYVFTCDLRRTERRGHATSLARQAAIGSDATLAVLPLGSMVNLGRALGVPRDLEVPVAIHAADAEELDRPPEIALDEGDVLRIGELEVRVFHTPGHTAGGVCFYVTGHLFAGDTLFPGGPGNTRRLGGDFPLIVRMIEEKLLRLPDDTRVYPGHGLDTTIGDERPRLAEWIARGW